MNDTEKAFIDLNKKYLFLQHKLARYEMNGVFPPEYLLKKIEKTKRRLQIFRKTRNSQRFFD
jgi:hypothetical protein